MKRHNTENIDERFLKKPKLDDEYQWMWKNDSNNYVPYSEAINKLIEEAKNSGKPTARVDDERYIEFATGFQRRYDDVTKIRTVKRKTKPKNKDDHPTDNHKPPKQTKLTDIQFNLNTTNVKKKMR
eukprot:TRINITY_DN15993_c0_g1_i1.p1 TRINITY_DN15993_c0_g1~~TRINITY_DN15993_c0_g1_i1.p1  ORF type:complete len:126 (-),score=25.82 TRINITY_DN15993_c0_g1_i1:149-526(-)